MKQYILTKSNKKDKKLMVILPSGKKIHFGAIGYGDYIFYNRHDGKEYANKKKNAYIKRHEVNENWKDLTKAGTWSRFILWNKPTLRSSINDMAKKFNIRLKLK